MALRFTDIEEELVQLYKDLKQAADDQLQSLAQDEMTTFREAADRRDRIQEKITRLTRRISVRTNMENDNKKFSELREEIRAMIQKTMEVDRRMIKIAGEKRDESSIELDRLKAGRKGIREYEKPAPGRPKFVDRQG